MQAVPVNHLHAPLALEGVRPSFPSSWLTKATRQEVGDILTYDDVWDRIRDEADAFLAADLYHEQHECRDCGDGIECRQTDEECDRNGGIGQYGGLCPGCAQAEAEASRQKEKA